jgi:SAM-dependent methyltransferase
MLIKSLKEQPRSAWAEFYATRTGNDYLLYVVKHYLPFLNRIHDNLAEGDSCIELGCGTGTITKALINRWDASHWNPRKPDLAPPVVNFYGFDIDQQMCAMAEKRVGDGAEIQRADIRQGVPFHGDGERCVVHSHGVLEHMDDADIRQTIAAHRAARIQLHCVAGGWTAPAFASQRRLSTAEWHAICQPNKILTFNGGLDYVLVFLRRA